MGARVVGGGGIGAGGSLATVVGCWTGGGCGATVVVAAGVGTADVLTVAGSTGTGGAVVVIIGGDVAAGAVVDGGGGSFGMTICCAGWAGRIRTMAVAAAAASVARTTPARTIRLDHRLPLSDSASARGATPSPLPADSSTSSGSNK
jgi:hypothetical protein